MQQVLFFVKGLSLQQFCKTLCLLSPIALVLGSGAIEAILILSILCFVTDSLLKGNFYWSQELWFKIALVLWVFLILDSIVAIDPQASLSRALPWIRFPFFALCLQYWILNDQKTRGYLGLSALVTLLFIFIDSFVQYKTTISLTGHPLLPERLTGPFSVPKVGSFTARFLFVVSFFLLLDIKGFKKWQHIALGFGAFALFLWLILLSGDRMPMLLVALGCVIAPFLLPKPYGKIALSFGLIAIIAAMIALYHHPDIVERMFTLFGSELSQFWQTEWGRVIASGLQVGSQDFWLGAGLKNYRILCSEIIPSDLKLPDFMFWLKSIEPYCSSHPHNIYVEWFAESGFIGLCFFVGLVTSLIHHFYKNWHFWKTSGQAIGLVITTIMIFWPLATSMSFFANWHSCFIWFIVGWAISATSQETNLPKKPWLKS